MAFKKRIGLFKKSPCADMPWSKFPIVVVRSFFGVSCFVCATWALTLIPLSLQTILFNLNPFWVSILGYFINGEKVTSIEYICMSVSFLGVFGMCLGGSLNKEESEYSDQATG